MNLFPAFAQRSKFASRLDRVFEVAYGPVGGIFLAAAITIFAWTTIIGMYYSCAKSVNYAFGDTLANRRATRV